MGITAVEIFNKIRKHQTQIVSLFLCFVIIFTCSIAVPFTQAHAGPEIVIAPALLEIAAQILIILGITVTSYLLIKQWLGTVQTENPDMYTEFVDMYSEIYGYPDGNGKAPKDGGDISINAGMAAILTKMYQSAKGFFKDKSGTIEVPDINSPSNIYHGIEVTTSIYAVPADLYKAAPYNVSDIVTVDGKSYYWNYSDGHLYYDGRMVDWSNGSFTCFTNPPDYIVQKWGFLLKTVNGIRYIFPYFVIQIYTDASHTVIQNTVADNYPNDVPFIYGSIQLSPDAVLTPLSTPVDYTNDPKYAPSTIIGSIAVADRPVEFPYTLIDDDPDNDDQEGALIDTGIIPGSSVTPNPDPTPTPSGDPEIDSDEQYKPAITELPDIGGLWDYVRSFMSNALIWMLLWFTGFSALPIEIQWMLWALLVITIVTGLLGVFLK